jgi:uncharacterized protein (DUF697 family)
MSQTAFEIPGESFSFGEAGLSTESEFPHETYETEAAALEAELVNEFLEITTEAELEEFLGKLARSVVKGASSFIKSPVGKALGGVLKNVAKKALPAVGGALGSMVLPGVGTAIGSKLGSLAGGLLEAEEAEMLTEGEAEYEAAQRYVRFARSAYRSASRAPRDLPPLAVARAASISAARRHAPALLRGDQRMSSWRRRRPPYGRRRRPAWTYYEPAPWYAADPGDDAGPGQWPGDGSDGAYVVDGDDYAGETAPAATAPGTGQGGDAGQGRWVRRGNRIVLLGA